MEKINITITPDGAVKLDLDGFTGGKCLEATKALEALLGGVIEEREMTSEYYSASETVAQEEKISVN
jgi:hypothetical protein